MNKFLALLAVPIGLVLLSQPVFAANSFWDAIIKAQVESTSSRWQGFEEACLVRHECKGVQAEALAVVNRERQRLMGGRLDTKAVNAVAEFLAPRLPYVDDGMMQVTFDGIEALGRGRGVCWVYALAAYAMLHGIDPMARIEFRLAIPPKSPVNHAYTSVWADGVRYNLEQANPRVVPAVSSYLRDYPVYLAVGSKGLASR